LPLSGPPFRPIWMVAQTALETLTVNTAPLPTITVSVLVGVGERAFQFVFDVTVMVAASTPAHTTSAASTGTTCGRRRGIRRMARRQDPPDLAARPEAVSEGSLSHGCMNAGNKTRVALAAAGEARSISARLTMLVPRTASKGDGLRWFRLRRSPAGLAQRANAHPPLHPHRLTPQSRISCPQSIERPPSQGDSARLPPRLEHAHTQTCAFQDGQTRKQLMGRTSGSIPENASQVKNALVQEVEIGSCDCTCAIGRLHLVSERSRVCSGSRDDAGAASGSACSIGNAGTSTSPANRP